MSDSEFFSHVVGAPAVKDMLLDHSKVGFWKERVLAWERGEKIAPITMDVAWTRKCNAACHFCAAQYQASEGGEITKEIAFQFLEDAAEIGVKGVSLISDGESTMVPWYAESIEHAASLGLKVGVGSNGILLVPDLLERILPHLSYLRFNFSAGERKRYAEIMGVKQAIFDKVSDNIRAAMALVRRDGLACNVNMNLVCEPRDADQLLPFARMAKELGVHYGIIKHCVSDPDEVVHVDYREYVPLFDVFKQCEALSDPENNFRLVVKWARIQNEGKRAYNRCFGTPFIMQMSGNGLVGPCGPMFNEKYRAFHIGNITTQRFKDIWASDRYWDVIRYLGSDDFNPQERCTINCLQTLTNDWLFKYKNGEVSFPQEPMPIHSEFI